MEPEDADPNRQDDSEIAPGRPDSMWCLVGNVIGEHVVGSVRDIRRGTKQFTTGTKVYCLPAQWGDGYEVCVAVGRARRPKDWITVVMRTDLISNWRAKVVYDPVALERLRRGLVEERQVFNRQWESQKEVESVAQSLRQSGSRIDRRAFIQKAADAKGVAWELVRRSMKHDLWRCGETLLVVPRYEETNELTALGIYHALEPELGERWWR